jgi:hypothetical protein
MVQMLVYGHVAVYWSLTLCHSDKSLKSPKSVEAIRGYSTEAVPAHAGRRRGAMRSERAVPEPVEEEVGGALP